ncbi:MAG: response regulator transcription factor [Candidatus Riflebacteria bacterium]
MSQIGIGIVDDHDLFRDGLKLVLANIPGFRIEFEAKDGESFLKILESCQPDIVLMDINLPGNNGIEITREAVSRFPLLKIIALTMYSDHVHYLRMIEAGASGFIPKNTQKHDLQQAISDVFSGKQYVSENLRQKLMPNDHEPMAENLLTLREIEILNLICRGMTTQETAKTLFISEKTVEGHRASIFRKARVRNIAELIIWAVKNKILTLE